MVNAPLIQSFQDLADHWHNLQALTPVHYALRQAVAWNLEWNALSLHIHRLSSIEALETVVFKDLVIPLKNDTHA